jgi:hypothetical protein
MAEEAVDFKLFRYDPNLGAAVFFVLLFTAAASLHTYQYVVTKTWFFTAFVIGCWCKSAPASSAVPILTDHMQSRSLASLQCVKY